MSRIIASAIVIAMAAAGCRSADVESMAGAAPQRAAAPTTGAYLPVGTDLSVELNQTLSTGTSQVGDRFTATVRRPVVATNGEIAVPQGAVVHGVVTGLDSSDWVGEQAAIRLAFENLTFGGRTYPFDAAIIDTDIDFQDNGLERAGRDAAIGAAAGAALGAIMSGDLSGILTGAILGAGAGTIISLGRGEVEAAIPAGSDMVIRSTQYVQLR